MSDVWIYHPTLDAYAEVPETAVGMHAMSGWVQQDPPPPEPESESEAEPEPTAKKTTAKKTTSAEEK
jgi:hypothetical protein